MDNQNRPSLQSEGECLEDSSKSTQKQKGSKSTLQEASTTTAQCAIKLLVSNNVAGRIIGKAGQFVSQLQSECGCRIKLSQSNHYFPGTNDRVCLVEGKLDNVHLALAAVYGKIREQMSSIASQRSETTEEGGRKSEVILVRLLVPTASCGMLIGKGGNHIKEISDKSGAKIQLAQKDEATAVVTSERVLTITANIDSAISCTHLILDDMIKHPDVSKYSNQTTSYSKISPSDVDTRSKPGAQRRSHEQSENPSDYLASSTKQHNVIDSAGSSSSHQPHQQSSVQMTVPDELISAIIGRNRTGLADLQARSGARIIVSNRGDFVPGTSNRIIEIIGPNMQACATAQYLISQIIRSQMIEHQTDDAYQQQPSRGRYNPSGGSSSNAKNSRR